MQEDIYPPEEVAEILNLKVTTVRRFIREGKLPARKVGRQWRIFKKDLEAFLGHELPRTEAKPSAQPVYAGGNLPGQNSKRPRIQASTVVDIQVKDTDEAARLSNNIVAVLNCKDPSYGAVRFDHIYYKEDKKARFLFWGSPKFIGEILLMLERITT